MLFFPFCEVVFGYKVNIFKLSTAFNCRCKKIYLPHILHIILLCVDISSIYLPIIADIIVLLTEVYAFAQTVIN